MFTVVPSQIVTYLDSRYPQAVEGKPFYLGRDHAPTISYLLKLIDSLTAGAVTLQGEPLAEFGEAVEAARSAVDAWNHGDVHYQFEKIPGRNKVNPLTFLRRHLASLRDDVLVPVPATLLFIPDSDYREALRLDIAAANRSFGASDWKGCTVVAGSVVEALLLWAVENQDARVPGSVQSAVQAQMSCGVFTQKPPTDVSYWGLYQLTEVAHKLGLVSDVTAAQCRIAKEFRNLIHPGRSARMSQRSTVGTALSALAAVEHVIVDLS